MQDERSRKEEWIATGVLLAITLAVYIKTAGFGFVLDDWPLVVQNRYMHSWQYLKIYFTQHSWSNDHMHPAVYLRPMFLVWLRFLHSIFGLEPAGWHVAEI